MKSVLKAYQTVGNKSNQSLARKPGFIFEGAKPVIDQTPGRLQYYRAENEPFLPDEVKWGLKFPTKFAIREHALTYEDEVQQQIIHFLGNNLKYDYLNANKEINLDLVLAEASLLHNANDTVKALAESGELQKLHERCAELDNSVQTNYIKVFDQLDRVIQQIEEQENEIYEELRESENIENFRAHGATSFAEALSGLANSDAVVENFMIAQTAAEGADSHTELYSSVQQLRQFIGVRAEVVKAKIAVHEEVLNKVIKNDDVTARDVDTLETLLREYHVVFDGDSSEFSGDAKVFFNSVDETNRGDLATLLEQINSHDQAYSERASVYSDYVHADVADSQTGLTDNFRVELLKHLAGSIVIKEHRVRYQKEQFDRFVASTMHQQLLSNGQTLRSFASHYAQLIDVTISSSHNDKCPKIEANYDDFAEKTVRPLNGTIFYYFFSANRSGKTFAQWMLSSVRYPNDKLRRAYMRFFA